MIFLKIVIKNSFFSSLLSCPPSSHFLHLSLVGSFGTFARELVSPSNLWSLGFSLQFLQFRVILLFAKALCYPLHLTSSPSLSVFMISLLGLQLQLEQPQFVANSRFFSLSILFHCNYLSFPVLSTQSFCPQAQRYQ